MNKYNFLKLCSNFKYQDGSEVDFRTWVDIDNALMLQEKCGRWEIIPITNNSEDINSFYLKFPNGISGAIIEDCLKQLYNERKN